MSGRWEPYVISVLDELVLYDAWAKNAEAYHKWEQIKNDLLEKWSVRESQNPAVESDLKQIDVMLGQSIKDYRDDPQYLKELRESYEAYFVELIGTQPAPFIPIGPTEMYRRNSANMEYSCTALYYCPGPDDDLIMCSATDLEFDNNGMFRAIHFRVKSTGEYIGDDEEIENSPYRIIPFEFDRSKWAERRPIVDAELRQRYKDHVKKLMTELRQLCKNKKCYDFQKDIPGEIDEFAKKVSSACYYYEQSEK